MENNKISQLRKELHAELLKEIKKLLKSKSHSFKNCITESVGNEVARIQSACWTSGYAEGEILMVQTITVDRQENISDSINIDLLEIGDLETIYDNLHQE